MAWLAAAVASIASAASAAAPAAAAVGEAVPAAAAAAAEAAPAVASTIPTAAEALSTAAQAAPAAAQAAPSALSTSAQLGSVPPSLADAGLTGTKLLGLDPNTVSSLFSTSANPGPASFNGMIPDAVSASPGFGEQILGGLNDAGTFIKDTAGKVGDFATRNTGTPEPAPGFTGSLGRLMGRTGNPVAKVLGNVIQGKSSLGDLIPGQIQQALGTAQDVYGAGKSVYDAASDIVQDLSKPSSDDSQAVEASTAGRSGGGGAPQDIASGGVPNAKASQGISGTQGKAGPQVGNTFGKALGNLAMGNPGTAMKMIAPAKSGALPVDNSPLARARKPAQNLDSGISQVSAQLGQLGLQPHETQYFVQLLNQLGVGTG